MRNLKKTISIFFIIIFLFSLCGCEFENNTNYVQPEEPHMYYKDIDTKIIDIDKKHWFASTHWYEVRLTVRSDEYNLEETFEIKGSGAFGQPKEWEYEKGDTVSVKLYSWVMDSTGEVVKRKINNVN